MSGFARVTVSPPVFLDSPQPIFLLRDKNKLIDKYWKEKYQDMEYYQQAKTLSLN